MVKQGDILLLQLNPSQGHEQQGFRLCVCLSNEIIFNYSGVIVVAPISTTNRNYPLYYELKNYKNTTGKVLLDQLRSIDPLARNIKVVGKLSQKDKNNILDLTKMIFDI